jgi:hypothetical protein
VGTAGGGGLPTHPPSKAAICEATKLTASGVKQACLATQEALAVLGKPHNPALCSSFFDHAFDTAERLAGPGVCPTEGDAPAIEALVDACFDNLKGALSGLPPAGFQQFPATGQTSCWDSAGNSIPCAGTGHDGDTQAGATLSYTDNGNGTITDNNTGLVWEKKSNDGTIHDKGNFFTWDNAFAEHIAGLNQMKFAGYNDWRLPNVKELQSIVNYQNQNNPVVSPAFNNNCTTGATVLTGSCTTSGGYWSASTYAIIPANAWFVDFGPGNVLGDNKSGAAFVRAVRGGSNLGPQ